MNGLESIGKMLLVVGGLIVLTGLLFLLAGRFTGLGRLPGDILFQRGNFTFVLPILTMIVVSIVLTIVLNIVIRLLR